MTRDKPSKPNLPASRANALRDLANRMVTAGDSEIATIIRTVLIETRTFDVIDLWEPREVALTYWVLMLTGVNQLHEMQIAKDLLAWQAFFSKDSARVLCVQSSERESFRCCSSRFTVHDCPTLVMSDSPEMKNNLKIEADLLKLLSSEPGELQRFLTRLQSLVENGRTIADLKEIMSAEAFWRGLKVVFKEVKGLVSVTLSPI
jgi:hypothetical protein